jgi:flagellar biosynthesis/type III secretory pathway M-ring protein FliF/YscJ
MSRLLAEVPALPLHTAGKYVAAAYVVLFAIVLIYISIMALRLRHVERDLAELAQLSEGGDEAEETAAQKSHERPPADGHAFERESTPA